MTETRTRTLCTFPGRAGDLLWALPTVRAISEALGEPVDLQLCGEFGPMLALLVRQPYLAGVLADPRWGMSAGWEPPALPEPYARTIHLGYRRWPALPLPFEAYLMAQGIAGLALAPLDLARPWITAQPGQRRRVVNGWTDCHFELKVGLTKLLYHTGESSPLYGRSRTILAAPGSRWETEAHCHPYSWVKAAQAIAGAEVFLGDCSALHVLAVALGKPCVIYEPMIARLDPIFWPLGKDGPQVTLVRGNDGEMTTDSRHTAETLERVLSHAR